jgi:16S rRNA (uracil1498-N3)-methyltransferase
MHRLYCSADNISGDKIIICDNEQVHHLIRVLRVKTGEEAAVSDKKGGEYFCLVEELKPGQVILEIINKSAAKKQEYKLTLACAIPKNAKMDDIIDKLTQLGVERIIPLKTERVVVKLDKLKEALRLQRWRKISQSASKQSQRNIFPVVDGVRDLKKVILESGDFDLKLIPSLAGERKAIKEVFSGSSAVNILVLIGPEGDFSPQELQAAQGAGFIPVSLGDLVFRVDTAAIAVASYIKMTLG